MYENLKKKIDNFYNLEKSNNIFYRSIFENKIEPDFIMDYTKNIKLLVECAVPYLDCGIQSCTKKNFPILKKYLQQKIVDETGHEKWAEDDIDHLSRVIDHSKIDNFEEDSYLMLILKNYKTVLTEDPHLFLVNIFFAEYLTVISTEECMSSFIKNSNLKKEHFSLYEKHMELDRQHVFEWKEEIKELSAENSHLKEDDYSKYLDSIMFLFSKFLTSFTKKRIHLISELPISAKAS